MTEAASSAVPAIARKKILIAEDESQLRNLFASTLAQKGYLVAAVEDGIEACMTAEADPPDLVVLDLLLPGRDGYTVLLHLRSRPATRHTRVIILSGEPSQLHEHTARTLGAEAFLSKPLSTREFLQAVETVLAAADKGRRV